MNPEFALLLCCARAEPGALPASEIPAGLDWDAFLLAARRHGVLPLAQQRLAAVPSVPDRVLAALADEARRNALHSLVLAHELLRLLALLRDGGVVAVPYKGPALAAWTYGEVALRAFKDLDLIIREPDFERASELLIAAGYTLTERAEGRFHASFRNRSGVLLELHRAVVRRNRQATDLDLSAMFTRLEPGELLGETVLGLSPEDTLLLLCLHGAKHEWQGLLWLADVAAYLRAQSRLDFIVLLARADMAQVGRTVRLGLKLAHEWLGAALLEVVREQLDAPHLRRASALVGSRFGATPGLLAEGLLPYQLRLELEARPWHKLRIMTQLVSFLLTPNAQDRAALPRPLAILSPLIRPWRLARAALKART